MINEACKKEIDAFVEKLISGINPKDLDTFASVLSMLKTKTENMKKEDMRKNISQNYNNIAE